MANTVQANVANSHVTNTSGGVTFDVSTSGDIITGGVGDDFSIQDSYINYNTYNETSGGTMQAGVNNALFGFATSFSAATGISMLSGNGHADVQVGSEGAILNLTGISLSNVGVRLDQLGQTVTAPQTGLAYTVYTYNDTINGGGYDTFTIADSYNNYNSYNDITGGTMQAGTNNALLAFSNSLTAADGISTLSANGYTGVQAGSEGAVLNTTGISLNGIGISLAQNGQTVTVPQSGLDYTVSTYNDMINAGGGDTFTVVDPYIEYNSYNDVAGGTVQAGTNNALLGFSNSLTAVDGITTISANGHTGVDLASNGAVLNTTGIALSGVGISLAESNQTVTAPQTGLNYIVSNYGDTINGGGSDTFTVVDDYNDYNTYNDVSGGQILGGANNAMIGITGNFSAAANGISAISGNGYTGVTVASTGGVFNLSGVALSNVTIAANQTNAQTITSTSVGNSWTVSGNNATLNGAGHDTFTVDTAYNYYNTYNEATGGCIIAGENNAFIGMAGNVVDGNGIAAILGNGTTGSMVGGNGAVFNLAGVRLSDVTVNANQNNQTITTTQGNTLYQVSANGDLINGVGGDIFTVKTAYNYYNSYNDLSGGMIQAGFNNAVIGLSGSFGTSNGISTITGNGFSGVTISGNTAGATLDFSQTSVSDATIKGGANNVTIITPGGNQTLTGGGTGDIFVFTASAGQDVITDFRAGNATGHDVILLNGSDAPSTFAALLRNIADIGNNTVITLANGGTITLDGVSKESLTAADFSLGNVAAGLSASNGTLLVGHGSTTNLTSTIESLITQGALDGVSTVTTVTSLASTNGSASVTNGGATYTAPVSGSDTVSFTTTDQFGDEVSGQIAVTVDAGPTVANGALTIGHGQSSDVTSLINGLITKGLVGDTETVVSTSGDLVKNDQGEWIYTAPTSGNTDADFTVTDQLGDVANGQIAVAVDAGPTVASGALTIGHGQSCDVTSLINSLITKGLAGDAETITATSGNLVKNAQGEWIYTAPTSGTTDSITFQVTDQLNDVAIGTVAVTLPAPLPPVAVVTTTVVNLSGYNNAVIAPLTVTPPTQVAGNSITGPVFGNTTITGTPNNITITAQGYNNTVIAGGGNDTVNAGLSGAVVTVSNGNGNNTVQGSAGMTDVVLGNGNDAINLNGYDNSVELGSGDNTINAGAGIATVQIGTGSNTIIADGSSNVISVVDATDTPSTALNTGNNTLLLDGYDDTATLGSADNSVNGSQGNLTLTIGNGSQVITADGYGNVINVGVGSTNTGSSNIDAGAGDATVTVVGTGANVVTADGYYNQIVVGDGQNVIDAGEGDETVSAGSGNNTITAEGYNNHITVAGGTSTIIAGQGYDTVNVGASSASVALSGYQNLVIGGSASVIVSGGADNTYQINSFAENSNMTINNFSLNNGDVLDLSNVMSHTDWNHEADTLSNYLSVSEQGSNTLVSINIGGASGPFITAVTLQNMGPTTLDSLQAHNSLTLF